MLIAGYRMKKNGKRYTAPIKANWFKPKRHEVNMAVKYCKNWPKNTQY